MTMDKIKMRLTNAVASQLSAAPHSAAKSELIEELSDNLYQRYLELTAAGTPPEEAYRQALDDLGDTDQLVDYLNSLQPDEPLPGPAPEEGSQLDALLANVEELVKEALGKAKSSLRDVKQTAKENLGVTAEDLAKGIREKVDQAAQAARETVSGVRSSSEDAPPAGDGDSRASEDQADGFGWQFSMGYSRDKGGFFTQWEGPCSGQSIPLDGPVDSQALQAVDVQVAGDVEICLCEKETSDVVISGDVELLEAFRSEDGVLSIRQSDRTASSSFFFRRGLACADVRLALPRRYWKSIRVSAAAGDVNLSGDVALGRIIVKTVSGDLTGRLPQCEAVSFRSTSGDLEWEGCAGQFQAETVSGDLTLRGQLSRMDDLSLKSVSGDIAWEGAAGKASMQTVSGDIACCGALEQISAASRSGEVEISGSVSGQGRCCSSSGGVRLESVLLPQDLELSSKSGDCEARIPDAGSFNVRFKTASGRVRSDFFSGVMGGRSGTFTYRRDDSAQAGEPPLYQLTSTSGDLALYRY